MQSYVKVIFSNVVWHLCSFDSYLLDKRVGILGNGFQLFYAQSNANMLCSEVPNLSIFLFLFWFFVFLFCSVFKISFHCVICYVSGFLFINFTLGKTLLLGTEDLKAGLLLCGFHNQVLVAYEFFFLSMPFFILVLLFIVFIFWAWNNTSILSTLLFRMWIVFLHLCSNYANNSYFLVLFLFLWVCLMIFTDFPKRCIYWRDHWHYKIFQVLPAV